MIITLKGANFSASNIGTLSTYSIRFNSNGITNANTSVDRETNTGYTATITFKENYELNGAITVTMGGADITSTAVSGLNINITKVTGNVVITVPAKSTVVEPETPTTYTFTINPTPTSATVTLSATGYSTVSGTGSKSITVTNGTTVSWTVSADGYTEQNGTWTASGQNESKSVKLTATGEPSTPSDSLAGTWVFNNDTLTEDELNAFGGFNAKDYGLSYTAYKCYKVNITFSMNGVELSSEYLVKSDNNVVLGYDKEGSAVYFALNGDLKTLDNRSVTITSMLAEVQGGQMLLDWLNSVATNTTSSGSGGNEPEGGESVGSDELAGTWTMNEQITSTPATFGGKNGKSGLGLDAANLYQGYALDYTAGSKNCTHLFTHTSVDNMLGYWTEGSTGVGALYINDAWSPVSARYLTIRSTLAGVEGGEKLVTWLKANGTKTS